MVLLAKSRRRSKFCLWLKRSKPSASHVQPVHHCVPVDALRLRCCAAVIAEAAAQRESGQSLQLRRAARRPRLAATGVEAAHARLDEVDVVVRGQIGVEREAVGLHVGVVEADLLVEGLAVDVALDAVGEFVAHPFFVHPGVRKLRADRHPTRAGTVDEFLQPVAALQFGVVAGARLDAAVRVGIGIGNPVRARILRPVDLALGVVRVVEIGERALFVVHQRDEIGGVGARFALQHVEDVVQALVE